MTRSGGCATASLATRACTRWRTISARPLWRAFTAPGRLVLLIDEIDKADIEFPNDLLQELDRMEFFVYETGETIRAASRPIVIITSNNEKELPDAFLRRCFFHYIRFPRRGGAGPDRGGAFSGHQARCARARCADPIFFEGSARRRD